jgi:A/G-specific adenine glycosylase
MPRRRRASVSASADTRRNVVSFARRLIDWQRRHGRHDLPWQGTRDPYRIWVAEVMLQQTQVATVLRYYPRLLEAFPDVAALARAPLDAVLVRWSGLGYYRRAHHLHAAARVVMAEYGGRFPVDSTTLAALPGVGRSTAAAVAAFASGERAAILDGNVKRVLARHRGIDGWPGKRDVEVRLWALAESLLPRAGAPIAVYTQALMDLGATICTRVRPRCGECPVAADCVARREGRVDELPHPRPGRTVPSRALRVLVVERGGRLALEKRPSTGIWAGLWSLPELALGDDIAAAVVARFGLAPQAQRTAAPFIHRFTHFALTLHPVYVRLPHPIECRAGVEAELRAGKLGDAAAGTAWLTRDEALASALPAPIRSLLCRSLGLETDDRPIAEIVPGGLLLRPTATLPVEIHSEAREREFDREEAAPGRALARPARAAAGRNARARNSRRQS